MTLQKKREQFEKSAAEVGIEVDCLLTKNISDVLVMDNIRKVAKISDEELKDVLGIANDYATVCFPDAGRDDNWGNLVAMFLIGYAMSKFIYSPN